MGLQACLSGAATGVPKGEKVSECLALWLGDRVVHFQSSFTLRKTGCSHRDVWKEDGGLQQVENPGQHEKRFFFFKKDYFKIYIFTLSFSF